MHNNCISAIEFTKCVIIINTSNQKKEEERERV